MSTSTRIRRTWVFNIIQYNRKNGKYFILQVKFQLFTMIHYVKTIKCVINKQDLHEIYYSYLDVYELLWRRYCKHEIIAKYQQRSCINTYTFSIGYKTFKTNRFYLIKFLILDIKTCKLSIILFIYLTNDTKKNL